VVLLDTHVLLWWAAGSGMLSRRATQAIGGAKPILISPVSCWEITTLVRKGRIGLDRDPFTWVRDLFNDEQVEAASLTPQAAAIAGSFTDDFPGDPADRLIYATAIDLVVPLVTKDRGLRTYAAETRNARVIW
jgi:PIN domain nuclease of toxin-antitoxin system